MSWREQFENLEGLQDIVNRAVSKFRNGSQAQTDSIKKKRINKLLKKASDKHTNLVDLANQEQHLYATINQAEHFVTVSKTPHFFDLEELLTNHKDKFNGTQEIIDYGCGNAVKSSYVYHLLKQLCPSKENRTLHLFDYNDAILTIANEVAKNLRITDVEIEPTKNIEEDPLKRRDKNIRLHFFLGQTIGNFRDARLVIENLNKSMRKGEYLVVEWLNREHTDYEKGNTGERNLEFLYRYFEEFGIPRKYLSTNNGHFMRNERNKMGIWNIGYLILNEEFVHPDSGLTLQPGTNLVGLKSHRFQRDELPKLFEEYGFEAVIFEREIISLGSPLGHPGRTYKRKYEPKGEKQYSILKKTHESSFRKKINLLLGGLAVSYGLLCGGYYAFEKSQINYCDTYSYTPEAIVCKIDENKISLPLKEITLVKPTFSSIDRDRFVIKYQNQNYSFEMDSFIRKISDDLFPIK